MGQFGYDTFLLLFLFGKPTSTLLRFFPQFSSCCIRLGTERCRPFGVSFGVSHGFKVEEARGIKEEEMRGIKEEETEGDEEGETEQG